RHAIQSIRDERRRHFRVKDSETDLREGSAPLLPTSKGVHKDGPGAFLRHALLCVFAAQLPVDLRSLGVLARNVAVDHGMKGIAVAGVLHPLPPHGRRAEVDGTALDKRLVDFGLVLVADNIGEQPQYATSALEAGDRAPALVQHREQFGMERIRRNYVVPVSQLSARSGHVLAELTAHGPIGLGSGTVLLLVA